MTESSRAAIGLSRKPAVLHRINKVLVESFKCFYTNADCLCNKHDELLILLSRNSPAIIGITEVKPKNCRYPVDRALLKVDGYELFDNLGSDGRGICLYVHK